jgi:hypothetical protein
MESFTGFIDNLISSYTHESVSRLPRSSHSSDRPIFIIGMPRSGTTLVEQILASHPDVYGGGELKEISTMVSSVRLGGLRQEDCDALARQYLKHLSELSATARFVTDKMPQNFLHLGFISLLFPQAHVIHCIRDPRDTCLSCFFQDFGYAHAYRYKQEVLGKYYNQYQRLMRHWRDVLDIPILDVSYEALVADQAGSTRAMLEYCDLEWDDRCLRFYENTRIANTASLDQVRRPVYTRSLGRWRHYEPYIQPLLASLKM